MTYFSPTHRFNLPWYGRSHVFEEARVCVFCGIRGGDYLHASSSWNKCLKCWGKEEPNPFFLGLVHEIKVKAVEVYCNVHNIDQEATMELYEKLAATPGGREILGKYDARVAVLKK